MFYKLPCRPAKPDVVVVVYHLSLPVPVQKSGSQWRLYLRYIAWYIPKSSRKIWTGFHRMLHITSRLSGVSYDKIKIRYIRSSLSISNTNLECHQVWSGFNLWWRHQMETFYALLAICGGNSPVPGEFPAQRPVTRSFDVFFDLRLNKWLSKQ